MSDQSEISLDADGDDFMLRLVDAGKGIEIKLTADNVLALGQSALAYRQNIMARRRPGAIFASPVDQVNVAWDALGEGVLMEMRYLPSGNVIFDISPDRVRGMIDGLEKLLRQRPASNLTRQ